MENHSIVFRDPARYAGWPANYGMWAWDDEIVLIFTLGWPDPGGGFHARDKSRPFVTMQARSQDGGETWSVDEAPLVSGVGLGTHEHEDHDAIAGPGPIAFGESSDIDFLHPDFAAMCGRTGLRTGARSWFYATSDRCRTWTRPFEIPMFAQRGIAARTDWLIEDQKTALLMLTATKPNGEEGRVFATRTTDGGRSFEFLSWVNESPPGFDIMPSSLRLNDRAILTAIRSRGLTRSDNWIDLYRSDDNAKTWHFVSKPVADTGYGGNPPSMLLLNDGRLVLTYGSRREPFGIYAVVSDDSGSTWSNPVTVRGGAGNHDIGYPKSVVRADGSIVIAYYFNEDPAGERYVGTSVIRF
ncbi:MAG: exo-alpha-sialidase [Chloroflexi bacterium]|nr:exo-alpha-sialidase [Chloroflexota bacterium]